MLVVIAIISILASMLSPSLRRALDASRVIACTNNLKQIGIMFHSYGGDFGDHIPCSTEFGIAEGWNFYESGFFGMQGMQLEHLLQGYGGGTGNAPIACASGDGVWLCPAGTVSLRRNDQNTGYGYWSARRNNWTHARSGGGMNSYQSAMFFMYGETSDATGNCPPVFSPTFASRMVLSYFDSRQPIHYCSAQGEVDDDKVNWFQQGRSNHEHAANGTEGPRPTLYVDGSVRALRYIAWLDHYESGTGGSNFLHTGPYTSWQLATGEAGAPGGLLPSDYPAGRHKPFTYKVFDP